MIIDPFMPPRLRVRSYKMFISAFITSLVVSYILKYNFSYNIPNPFDGTGYEWMWNLDLIWIAFHYTIAIPFNIIIICKIFCYLSRKGMSPNTMKSF